MTITFRPALREATPPIVGLAGPTKSGKTKSALRLAVGLAGGGTIAMINAEGPRGRQYADQFSFVCVDLGPPFSPERYLEHVQAAAELRPAVLIIDSMSHMHDGPGGMLEYHDAELDRIAGKADEAKRQKATWTAWIRPKAAENKFIYAMLGLCCPVILCFRAKQAYKIPSGERLGWDVISSDRVSFETLFTLVLPPHSKGVPDLSLSEMREPFDSMVPNGRAIDEDLGRALAKWAAGTSTKPADPPADPGPFLRWQAALEGISTLEDFKARSAEMLAEYGTEAQIPPALTQLRKAVYARLNPRRVA